MKFRVKRSTRGFSLIELTVALAIILVVSAIAAPGIMTAVRTYRIRGAAQNIQGTLVRGRMIAVRSNCRGSSDGSLVVQPNTANTAYFVDYGDPGVPVSTNHNGIADPGEPSITLPRNITIRASGPTSYAGLDIPATATILGSTVHFNSRGLPCEVNGSLCNSLSGGKPVVNLIYVKSSEIRDQDSWAAVLVTTAGRVKVYRWNGTEWAN